MVPLRLWHWADNDKQSLPPPYSTRVSLVLHMYSVFCPDDALNSIPLIFNYSTFPVPLFQHASAPFLGVRASVVDFSLDGLRGVSFCHLMWIGKSPVLNTVWLGVCWGSITCVVAFLLGGTSVAMTGTTAVLSMSNTQTHRGKPVSIAYIYACCNFLICFCCIVLRPSLPT